MITTAQLHALFLQCAEACTDTRQARPGAMFFALKGPNFNANAFATEALSKGCAYAVVDDRSIKGDHVVQVDSVLLALQELARLHRRQFQVPVIAITGTNGKTTTKELAHAVLGSDRSTLATAGNLNNHIGVPLTLLRLKPDHRAAIIEMGANEQGDISELCTIAEPTHGLITNIGRAHLEGFGSYEGVVAAKTELYADLRQRRGVAFVNSDDPLLMAKSTGLDRVLYGTQEQADTRGQAIGEGPFLTIELAANDGGMLRAAMQLIGDYNLPNALAAACIGRHFGVRDEAILQALERYRPSNNRSQFLDTGRNQVVMDAYNANPSSMLAALRNFAGMKSEREKLAILGDMLELGQDSAVEHQTIVDQLHGLGLPAVLVGPEFSRTQGNGPQRFASAKEALAALNARQLKERSILLKGSRGMELETLLPAL